MVIILSYYFILLVSCVIILYFLSISIWHSLIILLLRSPNFGINHNSEVVSHNFMYKYYYHSSYSEHFIYFLLFLTDMLFHSFHIHLNTAIVFLLFFFVSRGTECVCWVLIVVSKPNSHQCAVSDQGSKVNSASDTWPVQQHVTSSKV